MIGSQSLMFNAFFLFLPTIFLFYCKQYAVCNFSLSPPLISDLHQCFNTVVSLCELQFKKFSPALKSKATVKGGRRILARFLSLPLLLSLSLSCYLQESNCCHVNILGWHWHGRAWLRAGQRISKDFRTQRHQSSADSSPASDRGKFLFTHTDLLCSLSAHGLSATQYHFGSDRYYSKVKLINLYVHYYSQV